MCRSPQHDRDRDGAVAAASPRHPPIRRFVLPLVLVLLVAACGSAASDARVGQPAPPITATALDGSTIDLAAYRGHPLIVNFWASWCVPCRQEFPLFEEQLKTLGPSDGLQVLGVLYKDDPASAKKFLADQGATWPSATDPDGSIAKAYRTVAPPQTYFIDKDGILRGIQIGQVEAQDFATQYAKIKP